MKFSIILLFLTIYYFSEANNKLIKFNQVHRAGQMSQERRIRDTVFRIQDGSDPFSLNFLVNQRMKKKRRSKKAYPKEVLDMVEVSESGEPPNIGNDVDKDDPMEEDDGNNDPDLGDEEDQDEEVEEEETFEPVDVSDSVDLVDEIDGTPEDERGLGDDLVTHLLED